MQRVELIGGGGIGGVAPCGLDRVHCLRRVVSPVANSGDSRREVSVAQPVRVGVLIDGRGVGVGGVDLLLALEIEALLLHLLQQLLTAKLVHRI